MSNGVLLEQAEKNLKWLIKLGIVSLSGLSNSALNEQWVRFGTTFNSLGYPLPVDFRERLGKPYVKPQPTTRPPPAPKPQLDTSFGSATHQYTSPKYSANWKPKPIDIPTDVRLKGSFPVYLIDHIPGAEHYSLIDKSDTTGRIRYTTPGFDFSRDIYEYSFRNPGESPLPGFVQPDGPGKPTKEMKTPLNAKAVAFVPSATATPEGPPGYFSSQQTPTEPRNRENSTLANPHPSVPNRLD